MAHARREVLGKVVHEGLEGLRAVPERVEGEEGHERELEDREHEVGGVTKAPVTTSVSVPAKSMSRARSSTLAISSWLVGSSTGSVLSTAGSARVETQSSATGSQAMRSRISAWSRGRRTTTPTPSAPRTRDRSPIADSPRGTWRASRRSIRGLNA